MEALKHVRGGIALQGVYTGEHKTHKKLEEREATQGIPSNRDKGSLEEQENRRNKKKNRNWFSKNQGQEDTTVCPCNTQQQPG